MSRSRRGPRRAPDREPRLFGGFAPPSRPRCLKSARSRKAHGGEVGIERKGGRDAAAAHDSQAHMVDQAHAAVRAGDHRRGGPAEAQYRPPLTAAARRRPPTPRAPSRSLGRARGCASYCAAQRRTGSDALLLQPVRHLHLAVERLGRPEMDVGGAQIAHASQEARETGVAVGDQPTHAELFGEYERRTVV